MIEIRQEPRKRVLFVIPRPRAGGAERVIITLLQNLGREQFDLHLALLSTEGEFLNEIPEYVTVHNLQASRVRYGIGPLVNVIYRIRPSVMLSTQRELNLVTFLIKLFFFRKMKLVIREANTVSYYLADISKRPWAWKLLYRMFYSRADKIICQCKYMKDDLVDGFRISAENIVCIYNPVDVETINNIANMEKNPFADKGPGPHVVTAGRLYNQKGFDRLIRAFPALLKLRNRAQLWILGQGPRELEYKGLRDSLGLTHCVHFVGFQKNPYKWFKHADLFVLPSRYEGLPNALLEAMACGCPVLAIEHPGGTREILALLGELYRLRPRLDWDSRLFVRPSKEVVGRIIEHFGVKTIVGHYCELLEEG